MGASLRGRAALALAGLALWASAGPLLAQSGALPAPSRTMFKCTDGKKVSYSDQPCLGAQRLDVVPSRGLDKLSGTVRTGADVARERNRELFAEGIKPLTGMTPAQFALASRRHQLDGAARRACYALDPAIEQLEAQERGAARGELATVQRDLFLLRRRHKDLNC